MENNINEENYIIGVAVKFKDLMICLPKPNRHSDCFKKAKEIGLNKQSFEDGDQGFYLANGTYLTREEAAILVLKTNQPLRESVNKKLFSENLW